MPKELRCVLAIKVTRQAERKLKRAPALTRGSRRGNHAHQAVRTTVEPGLGPVIEPDRIRIGLDLSPILSSRQVAADPPLGFCQIRRHRWFAQLEQDRI